MKTYPETQRLVVAINLLEKDLRVKVIDFRNETRQAYEEVKPANLIMNAFHEIVDSKSVHADLFHHLLGLAGGFISKKIVLGQSKNPLRVILSNMVQVSVGIFVAEYADTIRFAGQKLIGFLKSKRSENTDEADRMNPSDAG
jgi:hypothetical protein